MEYLETWLHTSEVIAYLTSGIHESYLALQLSMNVVINNEYNEI